MLHNLNHLELRTGYTQCDLVGLAALLELSPNLETMILHYVHKNVENVSTVTWIITEILDVAAMLHLFIIICCSGAAYLNFSPLFSRGLYQKSS